MYGILFVANTGGCQLLPDLPMPASPSSNLNAALANPTLGTVAVIAHNPGCETLVSALSGQHVQFTTCITCVDENRVDMATAARWRSKAWPGTGTLPYMGGTAFTGGGGRRSFW